MYNMFIAMAVFSASLSFAVAQPGDRSILRNTEFRDLRCNLDGPSFLEVKRADGLTEFQISLGQCLELMNEIKSSSNCTTYSGTIEVQKDQENNDQYLSYSDLRRPLLCM